MGQPTKDLYALLFDININLCNRFPSLDPFKVRSQRFHDVMLIFRRLTEQVQQEEKAKPKKSGAKKTQKGIIMRPAQNDDWY